MMTPAERNALTKQVADDEDLTPKEQLAFMWQVLWMEIGFWQRAKAQRRIEKYGTKVNHVIEVLNFRKEMADL